MRRLVLPTLVLALAGPAAAATGPVNLVVTPEMKAGLRGAFLAAGGSPTVQGPLLGRRCLKLQGDPTRYCRRYHMYWARYRGVEWALATFWLPATGDTDQPEKFSRPAGGAWRFLGEAGGGPMSESGIPCPVLRIWAFSC